MRKTIVSLATLAAAMMMAGGAFASPLDGLNLKQINKALQSQPAPSKPPIALGRVKAPVALGKVKTGPLATGAIKECAGCKYIPAGGGPTAPPTKPGPAKPPGGGSAGTKPPTAPGGGMPGGGMPGGGMPPGGMAGGGTGGGHHAHGPYFYPGIGLGLAAVGVAAAAPAVVEYVQQPVYPQVVEAQPGYAQPVYAQPVPNYGQVAAPVASVANPFDPFVERLNGLALAMQQGLISKEEYRTQRQAVMASLDAGQVSRTVGVQQGLRQLRMMADGGALTPREYEDKRKEFVLFL